jgi:hypothetical protein
MNEDLRDLDFRFKDTGQKTVFDSYVLGYGVVKIGYATEFGPDILPTKEEKKKELKEKVKEAADSIAVSLGLKKPEIEEEEPEKVFSDLSIRSERPYLLWLSPFDFVIDPRARDITDARWVAQRIRRTIREIKEDRRYGKDKNNLVAESLDNDDIPETFIEDFQTADVWEVHYKDMDSPTGIRVLTFAAMQEQTETLMHEDSEYDLGGWQFEWLVLNKHGHRLYPVSTVSIIRPLINRLNDSFEAILEQVDKFQAKIAYNDRVSADGEMALKSPIIGALVRVNGEQAVNGAIEVISMQQVAGDMLAFVNQILDLVILVTGLTRAQLTGLSTAQTATEAQIGQSGQNLRRTDEAEQVSAWVNRVVNKLWRVKAAFQDFSGASLIKEAGIPDPMTGMTNTAWFPPIDPLQAERLRKNKYKFHIEVGSMQKPNLEIVRAQFAEFMRNLMEPVVTQGLALEGKRLSASEAIKQWSKFFAESGFQDLSKLVVPVNDPMQQQNLMNYGMPRKNGEQNGNGMNPPNRSDMISAAAGERGQGGTRI